MIYDRDPAFKQKIENMPPFNLANLSPEEISLNHFEPDYLTYYPNANYPFYDDEVSKIKKNSLFFIFLKNLSFIILNKLNK